MKETAGVESAMKKRFRPAIENGKFSNRVSRIGVSGWKQSEIGESRRIRISKVGMAFDEGGVTVRGVRGHGRGPQTRAEHAAFAGRALMEIAHQAWRMRSCRSAGMPFRRTTTFFRGPPLTTDFERRSWSCSAGSPMVEPANGRSEYRHPAGLGGR